MAGRVSSDGVEYWFQRMQEERDRFLRLAFEFGIYTKSDRDALKEYLIGWSCPWATHLWKVPGTDPPRYHSWAATRYFVLHG